MDILWITLLLSTTALLAGEVIPNADLKVQLFCWFILTFGILTYQLTPAIVNIAIFLLIAIGISALFFSVLDESPNDIVKHSLLLASLGGVFGVSSGLVSAYPITTMLYLGIVGVYLFVRWVLEGRYPDSRTIGIGDRLYHSTIRLVRSTSGVAIQCIIYFGLFTTTSIISGYVIPLFFSELLTLSPKKFAINVIGFLFGILFFILLFAGWLKSLERAPYTARYLEGENPRDLYETIPPRQSTLSLALPAIGWTLTRIPAIDIQTHNQQVVLAWNIWIVILYIAISFILLLYCLACWYEPIRRILPISRFTRERHRDVNKDGYYYIFGGLTLTIVHLAASKTAAILILFACAFLSIEWKFKSNSIVTYSIVAVEFLLLYLFVGYLNVGAKAAEFWMILQVFLIIYILNWYRENPELLLNKLNVVFPAKDS